MSDQQPPQPRGRTPRRSPWATALMILVGVVLLLPGLCSVVFSVILFNDPGGFGRDPALHGLLIFCFLVGVGGVALIVSATRR